MSFSSILSDFDMASSSYPGGGNVLNLPDIAPVDWEQYRTAKLEQASNQATKAKQTCIKLLTKLKQAKQTVLMDSRQTPWFPKNQAPPLTAEQNKKEMYQTMQPPHLDLHRMNVLTPQLQLKCQLCQSCPQERKKARTARLSAMKDYANCNRAWRVFG